MTIPTNTFSDKRPAITKDLGQVSGNGKMVGFVCVQLVCASQCVCVCERLSKDVFTYNIDSRHSYVGEG